MEERFLLENNHRIIQYRPTYLQGSTISTTSSHHFRADSAVSFSTLPLDYSSVALFHCIAALPLYSSLQLLHCPLHGCCQCQSHAILAAKANDSSTISYCFQLIKFNSIGEYQYRYNIQQLGFADTILLKKTNLPNLLKPTMPKLTLSKPILPRLRYAKSILPKPVLPV